MREKLSQYVELLFAGIPDSEEIMQEIQQNTLDRFDDLVSQGKSPEAAYRLAIAGIGDISEILEERPRMQDSSPTPPEPSTPSPASQPEEEQVRHQKRAAAVAFYIACPIPLFILSEFGMDTLGLCLMLILIAAATWLLLTSRRPGQDPGPGTQIPSDWEKWKTSASPARELHKSIDSILWAVGLVLYFLVSFGTGRWWITWVIFLIIPAVRGLVRAIMDLKEAS